MDHETKEPTIQNSYSDPTILSEPTDRQRQRTKIWMILSFIFSGLLLLPWFGLSLFAAMIGWPYVITVEGWDLQAVLFSLMMFYPLYFIGFTIASRTLYKRRQYKCAAIIAIAPVLLAIPLVMLWAVSG